MMEDKDLNEYHSIGKPIKYNGKYSYVSASRIEDQGTRLYDVNGSRLPSVTTILGATKDQQFKRMEGKSWRSRSRQNQKFIFKAGDCHAQILGALYTRNWVR